MSKFILFLAVLFLVYQIAKPVMRRLFMPPKGSPRRMEPRRDPAASDRSDTPDIDYSKLKDADFRDID